MPSGPPKWWSPPHVESASRSPDVTAHNGRTGPRPASNALKRPGCGERSGGLHHDAPKKYQYVLPREHAAEVRSTRLCTRPVGAAVDSFENLGHAPGSEHGASSCGRRESKMKFIVQWSNAARKRSEGQPQEQREPPQGFRVLDASGRVDDQRVHQPRRRAGWAPHLRDRRPRQHRAGQCAAPPMAGLRHHPRGGHRRQRREPRRGERLGPLGGRHQLKKSWDGFPPVLPPTP